MFHIIIILKFQAAPVITVEIDNDFDSDGAVLHKTATLTPGVPTTSSYDFNMEYSLAEETEQISPPSPNTIPDPVPESVPDLIELIDETGMKMFFFMKLCQHFIQ